MRIAKKTQLGNESFFVGDIIAQINDKNEQRKREMGLPKEISQQNLLPGSVNRDYAARLITSERGSD